MSATTNDWSPATTVPRLGYLVVNGIVGDLGMGPRDPRQQGRLARVGKPDQADVGDDLQLHDDPALFAGMTLLDLAGGPVGRRFEMGVAVPAASAARHDHFIAGSLQVAEHVAAVAIANERAGRDLDDQVLARPPEAIGALAVLAAVRLPVPLVRKVGEVGMAFRGAKDDAAAMAAVAAVGAAPRCVFLPAEAEAAVAPIPSSHEDRHAVDEHVLTS